MVCLEVPRHMLSVHVSRWFLRAQHVDPEEAVRVHQDVKARQSVAIHWGTFNLTCEVCIGSLKPSSGYQLPVLMS